MPIFASYGQDPAPYDARELQPLDPPGLPGLRTWASAPGVDAWLMPATTPLTKDTLRMSALAHFAGQDPHPAGGELPVGVYRVIVDQDDNVFPLNERISIEMPGSYLLSRHEGPGAHYRWTRDGEDLIVRGLPDRAPAWNTPGWRHREGEAFRRARGQYGRSPEPDVDPTPFDPLGFDGLWTWACAPGVDAWLIPATTPLTGDVLRMSALAHARGQDPYPAGGEIPRGTYRVILREDGNLFPLNELIHFETPGAYRLSRHPGSGPHYRWTQNGAPLQLQGLPGGASAWTPPKWKSPEAEVFRRARGQ